MNAITGVVLAGGGSRRFGANKALAPWNGRTLVETVVKTLADVFPSNLLVVKEPQTFRFVKHPGLRVVKDLHDDRHSLGGLWSGLSHAASNYAFVCACDMPFIQLPLIQALSEARSGYDAVIPVWRGMPQPLCGIYSRHCRSVISCLIKENHLKVQGLFAILRTRFFLEDEVKAHDPKGLSFVDLDTREDYERFRGGPC